MSAKRKVAFQMNEDENFIKNPKIGRTDESEEIKVNLKNGNGEVLGERIGLSINSNTADLTKTCNVLLQNETNQLFSFYINGIEVLETVGDVLKGQKTKKGDNVIEIVYEPEVPFKVFAVTRCSSTIEGHASAILDIHCSPDGRYLASGSGDKTVRFWDVNTETPQFVCKSHTNWVLMVGWSSCGRKLASGCKNGQICLWNPSTGKQIGQTLTGHTKWVMSISWKPLHLDGSSRFLTSSSKDASIIIWDSVLSKRVMVLTSHMQSVTCVKWSGSDLIYSSSQDRTIKVWNPSEGTLIRTLEGHGHWVNHLTLNTDYVMRTGWFDPSDVSFVYKTSNKSDEDMKELALKRFNEVIELAPEVLVSSSDDFTMTLWKVNTKNTKQITKMVGHQQPINEAAFSPNGKLLASASFDKSVKLWSGRTGGFLKSFRGHVQAVYKVCWSSDSRLICSASADSTIKVWDVVGKLLFDLPGHSDEVYALDWSPDGQRVVSGGKDKVLKIWKK